MAKDRKLVTVRIDRQAVKRLAFSKEAEAIAAASAAEVATTAKSLAPARTGAYRAGIIPKVVKGKTGYVGLVVATHFTSRWIEYGNRRQRPRAVLSRALEAVFRNQIGESDERG